MSLTGLVGRDSQGCIVAAARPNASDGSRTFVAASLCEVNRRCGHPNCKCARGQPHKAHVLTRKVDGKTETVHVPKELLEEVRGWVNEYKRIKQLIREV
ncbi:hypothetical protein HQ576_09620, partial [bacterium]|nr:hypothetical protein [bacterium]